MLAGDGCTRLGRLGPWVPGRRASGGPEDAPVDGPSQMPASVRGTEPLSLSPGGQRGRSLRTPLSCRPSRRPTFGHGLQPPWVGQSCGPHLGTGRLRRAQKQPCLPTRLTSARGATRRLRRSGERGTRGPPVAEEGSELKPLRLGTARC